MSNTKKNGCTISHNNKTITLTKAYAKKANTPGTKEFRELANLHKTFPDYDIVMRSAAPNKDKEKHKGLTIPHMEHYIKNVIKDKDALAEFNAANDYYKGMSGYYGKMKKWFLAKYPDYKEIDFATQAESNG